MKKILCLILFTLGIVYGQAQNCKEYPQQIPGNRVYDFYNKIDPADESYLQSLAIRFENTTGFQMAIVTLESLGGKDEFTYAQDLFNCWGIGEKEVDNGLLIIWWAEDRAWRIHTGRKTEIYLTDATSSRIGNDILVPSFIAGDPSGGFRKAVDAIVNHLGWQSWEEREAVKALQLQRQKESIANFFSAFIQFLLLCIAGFLSWLFFRNRKIIRRVKAKIKSWEEQMLAPMNTPQNDAWPNWAKKSLAVYQGIYEKELGVYSELKVVLLEALGKRPKKTEESNLPQLEKVMNNMIAISKLAEEIPREITRYQTNAGMELRKTQDAAMKVKEFIIPYLAKGYKFESYIQEIDAHIQTLDTQQHALEDNVTPDCFKTAFDSAKDVFVKVEEIKNRFLTRWAYHKRIDKNAADQKVGIDSLQGKYKEEATAVLNALVASYPEQVYADLQKEFIEVDDTLKQATSSLEEAVNCNSLEVQEFDKAYQLYSDVVNMATAIGRLYEKIEKAYAEQQKAKLQFPTLKSSTNEAIKKAEKKCENSDVDTPSKTVLSKAPDKDSSAKTLLSYARTRRDVAILKSGNMPVDWSSALKIMKEALVFANSAHEKAEKEVEAAKERRRKVAQQAAHDAVRRQQQRTYSSSPSPSGRSFGGGRSGGGGAGGRY